MVNANSGATVANCRFTGNSADFGGGMFNWFHSNDTVTNCTFSGNSADFGGGMYNLFNRSLAVTNCTFTGNSATVRGGGLVNDLDSSVRSVAWSADGGSVRGIFG